MAQAKEAQQANALLTKYTNLWQEKYGKKPVVNRFKMKWGMMDFIESVGYEEAQAILAYYFRVTKPGHPLEWFLYNFEDLASNMEKRAADDVDRAKKREITRLRVEELRAKNEQLGSKVN